MTGIKSTKTLVAMRIAQGIKGVPSGTIKLVQAKQADRTYDYALFVNDEYLGSIDGVVNEQQAVLAGLGKIRELLALLSE